MGVPYVLRKRDVLTYCPICGGDMGRDNSIWLMHYGYDRVSNQKYSCFSRVCENCFERSLLGSRKKFYCQGCGSFKPINGAEPYALGLGWVYLCKDCHDSNLDDYYTSDDFSFDRIRYDCICSYCGRAFMKSDTNWRYHSYEDDDSFSEPCVCDACSGMRRLAVQDYLSEERSLLGED